MLADHPFTPSGVGSQTKYFCEALLETGRYSFICFGGAIKHQTYQPMRTEEWGDDWIIYPVDGYGNQDQVRSVLRQQKPDLIWFMTDPRFWGWLWMIENEVRPLFFGDIITLYYNFFHILKVPSSLPVGTLLGQRILHRSIH